MGGINFNQGIDLYPKAYAGSIKRFFQAKNEKLLHDKTPSATPLGSPILDRKLEPSILDLTPKSSVLDSKLESPIFNRKLYYSSSASNPELNESVSIFDSESERLSSQSSRLPSEDPITATIAPDLAQVIPILYVQQRASFQVWDIFKTRLETVLAEYKRHKKRYEDDLGDEKEILLAYLYCNFFDISSSLLMLYQKHENGDGVNENSGTYNQILYELNKIHCELWDEFIDRKSIVNSQIKFFLPRIWAIENWGGVSADGSYISHVPRTVTQIWNRDYFIFLNNIRLFVIRLKNTVLTLSKIPYDQGIMVQLFGNHLAGMQANLHSAAAFIDKFGTFFLYLAWIYYLLRFIPNMISFVRHVVAGPWMNENERQLTFTVRLENEFRKRGFQLANDLVWCIIGGIVCFGTVFATVGPIATIILTASLYVFDVINTVVFALLEIKELKQIRNNYADQIIDELMSGMKLDASNKEVAKKINFLRMKLLGSNDEIKKINLDREINQFSTCVLLTFEERATLKFKLKELSQQLLVVNDKIEAREKIYHYNLSLAAVFMFGMALVAAGGACGMPPLSLLGLAIVVATATIQLIISIKEKIDNAKKPTPQSYFFKTDSVELKRLSQRQAEAANDEEPSRSTDALYAS